MTTKRSKGSSGADLEREIRGGPVSFGDAVKALRIRGGLSQATLAKRMKFSRQYLCDVEKGRRQVSPEQAARFARAFRHPPQVLVELALQDAVRASGLKLRVMVEAA